MSSSLNLKKEQTKYTFKDKNDKTLLASRRSYSPGPSDNSESNLADSAICSSGIEQDKSKE